MKASTILAVIVTTVLAWSVPPAAFAVYTPNPAARWQPGVFSLMADLILDSKDLDPGPNDLDRYGFFARPSYSLTRNFSIYGRLGLQGADDIDTGLAYGFGAQASYELPSAPAWAIGAAVDFFYWSADIERTDKNIEWTEFQITPAVSYAALGIPGLSPYAGIMFDFVSARHSISEDDPVGLLVGTSYDASRYLRLEAQVRLVSETGIMVSAGYNF